MTERRNKKIMSIAIDPALRAAIDDYIKSQAVPPSITAVIETSLREFLEKAGCRIPSNA